MQLVYKHEDESRQGHRVRVYFNSAYNEYMVRLFNGAEILSDYFSDDEADAVRTAEAMLCEAKLCHT